MSEQNYDAVLEDWSPLLYDGVAYLYGKIFRDSKGRFADGTDVRTSPLLAMTVEQVKSLKKGDIVKTRSSTYLLGRNTGRIFNLIVKIEDALEDALKEVQNQENASNTPSKAPSVPLDQMSIGELCDLIERGELKNQKVLEGLSLALFSIIKKNCFANYSDLTLAELQAK